MVNAKVPVHPTNDSLRLVGRNESVVVFTASSMYVAPTCQQKVRHLRDKRRRGGVDQASRF